MNDYSQVTALLSFIRHGEKDVEGKLTTRGFYQARQRGLQTASLGGEIILFHSGVDRVKNTVRTAAAHLHLDETSEESLELGQHMVDYISPNLHFLIDAKNKGVYHEIWENIDDSKDAENERMRKFLELRNITPEPGVWLSPKQMAQNIALMIGVQVRFANMTDPSTRMTFVNGTHEPVIMAFLDYFLNDFVPNKEDTVSQVGGTVDFAEGFEIVVSGKEQHSCTVTLCFRDVRRKVDLNALRAFAYSA